MKEETTGLAGRLNLQDKQERVKDYSKARVTEAKAKQKM